ncbi:MAG: alpha/beta hydrolase [Edaphobacter sp.]|uniref:alpha/beta hydrolase n=1 Tax=Edaphobacter sp. TaxID=1934404 RepID=UPI00238CF1DF|nr:alpha/beta hydrolase [Edaphobacter sp.]MDE1178405.1 alpha/beta hydrolase [Edaphobacter sp.]
MPRPAPKPADANAPPEVVSARWLLKALGILIFAALICSYISLGFLYSQGQWQIVLHPDPAARKQTPPTGLIHFGTDESGRPQLTGEWFAAGEGSHYGTLTILLLPGGDGSRMNLQETAHTLHDLGFNVFSFDYRGYGLSAPIHPSQQHLVEDSETVWRYLTTSRGISPGSIIPYGSGVGASLATRLANDHHEIPAVILDRPHTDLLDFAKADPRSGLLPAGMLFHERFPMAETLSALPTPKLLIGESGQTPKVFSQAATPKMTVELPQPSGPVFADAVRRFVDQYLPQSK